MKTFKFQSAALMAIFLLLFSPVVLAQENAAESEPAIEEDSNTAPDQEVEINEDNYRQFMELKDAGLQRTGMPENAYKTKAGLQTLDKLPEDSQKHLREQLREIIVQGDPWEPGDEDTEYPYTPSEAASSNQPLQKQEAEAWGDLVDSYHQREAQIYGNATRSQAAAAAAGQGGSEGSGQGSSGKSGTGGNGEQESNAQQAGQQNQAAGSYSPGSSSDQSKKSTAGVSQNAMEFLTSQSGAASGSRPSGDSSKNTNAGQQQPSDANEEAQNALDFLNAQSGSAAGNATTASAEQQGTAQQIANEDAQNALEFLKSNSDAESVSAEASPPTTTPSPNGEVTVTQEDAQNALEYLSGDSQGGSDPSADDGTLSIEELRNAQGVFNPAEETIQPPVDDEPN